MRTCKVGTFLTCSSSSFNRTRLKAICSRIFNRDCFNSDSGGKLAIDTSKRDVLGRITGERKLSYCGTLNGSRGNSNVLLVNWLSPLLSELRGERLLGVDEFGLQGSSSSMFLTLLPSLSEMFSNSSS